MELNKLSPEAKSFFDSLTPAMKESIMQVGESRASGGVPLSVK